MWSLRRSRYIGGFTPRFSSPMALCRRKLFKILRCPWIVAGIEPWWTPFEVSPVTVLPASSPSLFGNSDKKFFRRRSSSTLHTRW